MGYVRVMSGSCWGHVGVMLGLYQVHVGIKSDVGGYGTILNCVTFLVVFEAETGFSVLFKVEVAQNNLFSPLWTEKV